MATSVIATISTVVKMEARIVFIGPGRAGAVTVSIAQELQVVSSQFWLVVLSGGTAATEQATRQSANHRGTSLLEERRGSCCRL